MQIPLFVFCFYMYKWERTDLIPIRCGAAEFLHPRLDLCIHHMLYPRPNEGEELPCSILGPRTVREATFLKSFERAVPGVAGSN